MQAESNNQVPLVKGSFVGNYRINKKLGKGGFGITYLALDTQNNEPVVIKEYFPDALALRSGTESSVRVLSSDKSGDFSQGFIRFEREAMTLSEFNHPNIVKILTLFRENNTIYFVMKHIEGQSLDDELKQRKRSFSEQEIIQECLPVLQGLAEVHKKGILHLDIKPDNILCTKYGEPMLIDFGGARVTASQNSKDLGLHSSMIATDGYAPSEQYSLVTAQTEATDIYAFGMTLYKLMAPKEVLAKSGDRKDQVFDGLPDPLKPIREIAKGYSEALYQAVEACTQLKQKDRPQNVVQLQKILKPVRQTTTTRQPTTEKKPTLRLIIGCILVVVIAIAAVLIIEQPPVPVESQKQDDTDQLERQKQEAGLERQKQEDFERQKQAELERQKQEDFERQQEAELERQKQEDFERQQEAELERQRQQQGQGNCSQTSKVLGLC